MPLLSHHGKILVPAVDRDFLFVGRPLKIHSKPHGPDEKANNASCNVLRYLVALLTAKRL